MASLATDRGKRGDARRILFKHRDGTRKPIRLGIIPLNNARTILAHVSHLEACQFDGSAPQPKTAAWLSDISDTLREKLVAHGLCEAKATNAKAPTLAELIAAYKSRAKWKALKPNTRRNVNSGFTHLLNYFTGSRRIDVIHEADAEDYHAKLMLPADDGGGGLVESTANNVGSVAHRLYRFAVKSRLVDRSPFESLPKGGQRGNNVNVSHADSVLVLAQLTDTQERLLFGLARWGGLRCPSEPSLLRWGDIDWERKRFTVTAPKTERHKGHERRTLPIFPELMPLLEARYEEAEPGEELVLPFMQGRDGSGFSYIVKQAIRRAELTVWPRLWHSMRATRESELAAAFPAHVAAKWIGNSVVVAMKHYLMVAEKDFATAAETTAHNAAQPSSASTRTGETALPASS